MKSVNQAYWLAYLSICSAILLPVIFLGFSAPLRLERWLETGGWIESLPFALYLLALIVLVRHVIHLVNLSKTKGKQVLKLVLFSGLCIFLAGEESRWGAEQVFGWQLWNSDRSADVSDLHNFLPYLIKDIVGMLSPMVKAVFIIVLVCLCIAVIFQYKYIQDGFSQMIKQVQRMSQARKFLIISGLLLLFGLVDTPEAFGASYFKGQWALEETSEVLGSLALVFASLSVRRTSPNTSPQNNVS